MKVLEPCKVVVFGGIKKFRLKLKQLGISQILNDDESIKESDIVLILIEKADEKFVEKFVATNIHEISTFNNIDTKLVLDNEIKDIVHIPTIQSIEDFKFDANKIYYTKCFDEDENEYWLFKPREEKQAFLTAHNGCLSVCDGEVIFDDWNSGRIMNNNEITELRESTPSETEIYEDFWFDKYKKYLG